MINHPRKRTLNVFGSRVAYWVFNPGKSQTIVLVHGLRGTHHGLQNVVDLLDDFCIISPDLPGFGQSTPMTERQHDIAGYSDFVEALMDHLHLQRPVLLGHSFGSIVASYFAAHLPKRLSKLILINPIATPALHGPRRLFTKAAQGFYWLGQKLPANVGHRLLASKTVTLATSVTLAKTKDKLLRKKIHASHLQHFSSFQTRDALAEAFTASISNTATDYAANIQAPTLLIAGDIDDIAPLHGQYALEQQIPDAQLVVAKNVGHLIHHEAPELAAEAIKRFLS